jgi:NAD(P)-dependent dehydrogenase (short-subunit alcohol dehydrogenase family)
MSDLAGKRMLVVGASVSIGEAIATTALERGAHVAVAARRKEKLDEIVDKASDRAIAIKADCTIADDCERVVREAVDAFGGLDWVVYTPALFMLRELDEITAEEWRSIFDLNVIGAALTTKAALPHLAESRGRIVYFTSDSTMVTPHWPGLASYAISKVALDKMVKCWRTERPEVGFSILEVGGTEGSDGPNLGGWTPEQLERFVARWTDHLRPTLQERSVVAEGVLHALTSPSYVEHIAVGPPRA